MKKLAAFLGLGLLFVTVFAVAPAGAAPKQLAGTWSINGKFVVPTDTPDDTTVQSLGPMTLTIHATTDPTLFVGTFTGPENDTNYITIMMDSGANMHFAVSVADPNPAGFRTTVWGRGTAGANKITGAWSDDVGHTGIFIMTRQP